jgi:DNA repair exonuclease SbcCD ATPase subunit
MLPVKLKLENFFSHKKSEVDFTLFNSALLVGSVDGDYSKSNGSGKSSVMEGILWCLYNKSRSTTIDDVITWGENKCEVSLQFIHSRKQYLVRRTRIRATSTSTVDLLTLEENGTWKSLAGSTSGETNDRIVNLLKIDYKTFVNSAYFRQNDISEFATSEASKKKDILKSIIDISKWDGYEKDAKKKAKDLQTEIVKLQVKYDGLSSEVEKLLLSEEGLKVASSILDEKSKEKDELQERIEVLSENYLKRKNNIDTDSWDRATAEITSLKQKGKEQKTRFDQVISSLKKRLETRESISAKVQGLETKIKTLSFDPDIDQKIEKISSEWVDYSGAIQQSKIKLKELSEVSFVKGTCFTCNQSIDDDLYKNLVSNHESVLEHYKKKKKSSESRIEHLLGVKKELEKQKADNLLIEKSKDEIISLKSRCEILDEEIASGEQEKDKLYAELLEIKRKITTNEEILSSLKDETFQSIHEELKSEKARLLALSSEILEVGIKVGSLKEKTTSLHQKKKELSELKKSFSAKNDEMLVFDKMVKMFGKTGIQSLLLDAVILDLEKSANRILSSISDQFSISLETQRVGSDGISTVETLDLNVKKDGSLCGFSSLSGGEQFRIALSLRIALSELATQHGGSSLEFLLLDEINSPLDKSGVETLFVNIIKQLESKYKILVITHDDSLKERFESVLDVSKINGDSSISFIAGNITA